MSSRFTRLRLVPLLVTLLAAGTLSIVNPSRAEAETNCPDKGESWYQPTGETVPVTIGRRKRTPAPVYLVYKSTCDATAAAAGIRMQANNVQGAKGAIDTVAIVATLATLIIGPNAVLAAGTIGFVTAWLVDQQRIRLLNLAELIGGWASYCGDQGIIYRAAFRGDTFYSVSGFACQPKKNKDDPDPVQPEPSGSAEFGIVPAPEQDSEGTRCESAGEFFFNYPSGQPLGVTYGLDELVGEDAAGKTFRRTLWNGDTGQYESDPFEFRDCLKPQPKTATLTVTTRENRYFCATKDRARNAENTSVRCPGWGEPFISTSTYTFNVPAGGRATVREEETAVTEETSSTDNGGRGAYGRCGPEEMTTTYQQGGTKRYVVVVEDADYNRTEHVVENSGFRFGGTRINGYFFYYFDFKASPCVGPIDESSSWLFDTYGSLAIS